MTLYDRKNNFNNKFLSLCEKNCTYKGYNKSNKTACCECKIKNEFPKFTTEKEDLSNLLYRFIEESKKLTNFFVLTCTNVLFTSKGFKTNFGSYYNIVIFAFIILFGIIFFLKRYHPLLAKIKDINDRNKTDITLAQMNKENPDDFLHLETKINSNEKNNLGNLEDKNADKINNGLFVQVINLK